MNKRLLAVGVVQHACSDDAAACTAVADAGIQSAVERGAQLVVLPELHTSRYFCQQRDRRYFAKAEALQGPTTTHLSDVAARYGIVVIATIFEHAGNGRYYNTAVVLDSDGRLAGHYRKMHVPNDPGYYEQFYFSLGQQGFEPVTTSLGRLGVLICWDQWFPEAARLMALAGAELLIYPSAIGWDDRDDAGEQARQFDAWQTVQRGHAIANAIPVVACNRIGYEAADASVSGDAGAQADGIRFWGGSFITGAQGEVLAQLDSRQTAVAVARVDLARSQQIEREWRFFAGRRSAEYQRICRD